MKKYLSIAFAALAFAACAEKIDDTNDPALNGEIEQSYIAINLMSADPDTRAEGDLYEDGDAAERTVNTVHFFFFRQGAPFPVNATGTAPGGNKNWLLSTLNGVSVEGETANISDWSNAVLVLNNYKGQYPDKIVAVINSSPAEKAYTLGELHSQLTSLKGNDDGFVMSNSVYLSEDSKIVDATSIAAANIKTTSDDALDAPVDIYVERLAAKVKVTGNHQEFDTENTIGGNQVFVRVDNWSLYNANPSSYLLKNINTAWTNEGLGFTWNDSPYYRSYWADAGLGTVSNNVNWTDGVAVDGVDYCGENTDPVAADRTKIVLKGQLVDEDGDAVELVKWNGQEMIGKESLLTAAASQLQYTLYTSVTDGEQVTRTQISKDDIQCVAGTEASAPTGIKSYQVFFQLSSTGDDKTWVKSVEGNYTAMSVEEVNTYLKENLSPAIVYTEGKTFYYLDIRHLGNAAEKPGYYGVVRNHVYNIAINSIKGYGIPVYDPAAEIEDLEYPSDEEEVYVAAKINVLAWRVVNQEVNVTPQN